MKLKSTIYSIVRRIKLRTWIALVLIAILLPIVFFAFYNPSTTEASWYDEAYTYRKQISFTHNAALTDRRVSITIDTAALTTDKMQADCDDTRFTDSSGNVLRYQLVSGCDTSTTVYDVVFPTIINGDTFGYVYYANPNAISASQDVSSFTSLSPSGGAASLGTEEKSPGPVLLWRMDEARNDSCTSSLDVCDSSGTGTHGDSTTSTEDPIWQPADKCISGSCLFFTGSSTGNGSRIDTQTFTNIANLTTGSISFWVKSTLTNSEQTIFAFNRNDTSNTQMSFFYDNRTSGGNNIIASLTQDNTTYWEFTVSSTQFSAINETNNWHHYLLVHDGTTPALYIDGKSMTLTFSTQTDKARWLKAILSDATNDAQRLNVGAEYPNLTIFNPFRGFLDEFKIYPAAKTSSQAQAEYAARGGTKGAAAVFGDQTDTLSDGLVGHWKFDDNDMDSHSCMTSTVTGSCDSSGLGAHLTANGTMTDADYVAGKYGYGIDFDNTDDYFSNTNYSANIANTSGLTIAGWVNPANSPANHDFYFGLRNDTNADFYVTQLSGGNTLECRFRGSGGTAYTASQTVTAAVYQHVALVYDGANVTCYINGVAGTPVAASGTITNTGVNLYIGGNTTNFMGGDIDETRIYKRALSPSEIQSLANWAPGPTIHWKLDENTGTSTSYDSSGNGYNATLNSITQNNWEPGKYGSALHLDGSSDYIRRSDGPELTQPNITWSLWFKLDVTASSKSEPHTLIEHDHGSSPWNAIYLAVDNSANLLTASFYNQASSGVFLQGGSAVAANAWYHAALTYDGSNVRIYLNGELVDTEALSGTSMLNADGQLTVGDGDGGFGFETDGLIDEIRMYNYARTQQQIIEDLNAGHPSGGSPVGSQLIQWSFDEMQGTTAFNSIDANTDGTLTNIASPATSTSGWSVSGKVNNAIVFDGSNDQVTIATASDNLVDFNGSEKFSTGAWVYVTTAPGASDEDLIIGKWDETNAAEQRAYRLYLTDSDTDNAMNLVGELYDESANQALSAATTTEQLALNSWYYVTLTHNGGIAGAAGDLKIFINGIQVASNSANASFLGVDNVTSDFTVGDYDATDSVSGNTAFTGRIDEVQVYGKDLTESEIRIVMNANSAASWGGVLGNKEDAQIVDGAGNPPVGWWKFDDNTGTSTVLDSSGNGNHGTMTGSMVSSDWRPGKVGQALHFDGVDDAINVGTPASLNNLGTLTVSLWFKADVAQTDNDRLVDKQASNVNGWNIILSTSERIRFTADCDGGTDMQDNSSVITPLDTWYHVAITWDGTCTSSDPVDIYINGVLDNSTLTPGTGNPTSDSSSSLGIGRRISSATGEFPGLIDDVKIYDYERTPAQIAYDYNRGGPIAWWKLDECQGTTAYDATGNGQNGTITERFNDIGTCTSGNSSDIWYGGRNGKFNSSLQIDYLDYVTISDSATLDPSQITITGWMKTSGDATYASLFSKSSADSNNHGWYLGSGLNANGYGEFQVRVGSTNYKATGPVIAYDRWQHFAGTYDGETVRIYLDGVLVGSNTSPSGSLDNLSYTSYIGRTGNNEAYAEGQIDDVRIYNYALSEAQIKNVMNDTGAVRFGPSN